MKLHLIAATVVSAALLATGTVAASAATPKPINSPASADCQSGQRLEEARGVRDRALAGDYGARVQSRSELAQERRIRIVASFPAELQADLDELKATAPGEHRELAKEIADTALAGGYGAQAQHFVERVRSSDARQNCVADRPIGN